VLLINLAQVKKQLSGAITNRIGVAADFFGILPRPLVQGVIVNSRVHRNVGNDLSVFFAVARRPSSVD
jgi:hypothetical protein